MSEHHHSHRAGRALDTSRHDGDERTDRARQAAEALFAPKPRTIEPSAPTTGAIADQTARKPRVLRVAQVQPTRIEPTNARSDRVQQKTVAQLPAPDLQRIRTWLKYGMTIRQVADVYGVTVPDIERIIY